MRPIDADALYDRVSSFTGMFTDEIDFTVNLYHVLACIDVAPTIEQPTWISVKYRLPERAMSIAGKRTCPTSDEVLAFTSRGWIYIAEYSYSDGKWYELCEDERILEVTHWMPLPEPPKET